MSQLDFTLWRRCTNFERLWTSQNYPKFGSFGVLWPSLIALMSRNLSTASHGNKHEAHPNPARLRSSMQRIIYSSRRKSAPGRKSSEEQQMLAMSAAKTDPHVSVHVESYTVLLCQLCLTIWSQLTSTLHIYSQCVQCVPLRQFPLTIMHRPHAKSEELLTAAPHGVKTTPRSQASTSQYHHNHAWPQHSSARWCLIFLCH